MVSRLEQETLIEMLNLAKVKDLPKEYKEGDDIWIMAIARVVKCDNSINYVMVVNNGDNKPSIIKDLGKSATVKRFLGIYPVHSLTNKYMPSLRKQEDIVKYLELRMNNPETVTQLLSTTKEDGTAKTEEERKADKDVVKKYIVRCALNDELNRIKLNNYALSFLDGRQEEQRA